MTDEHSTGWLRSRQSSYFALAAAMFASGAAAQQRAESGPGAGAPASSESIIITGSHIKRPGLTAASPVTSLSGDSLKKTNSITAEALLQENPQFVPAQSATANNPGYGVATVDLRGLGPRRTLVLVDGKRLATYDTEGEVDLNIIPTALIKRVDILTGGASAVYGSDAIAGVVNFILNDRFSGLQADGSVSETSRGDAATRDISLTGGTHLGDRGNLILSLSYSDRDRLLASQRAFSRQVLDSYDLSVIGSSNSFPTVFDNTFNLDDSAPGQYQVGANGDLVPFYGPFNYNAFDSLQLPFKRYAITTLDRYEITPSVDLFFRGSWIRSDVKLSLAPTSTFGAAFTLSPDNAFLTNQQRSILFGDPSTLNTDGTLTVGVRRRLIESSGRSDDFTGRVYQLLGGVRGNFGANGGWEIFAQYARSKRDLALRNDIRYSRLAQAIDAVAGPGGKPVCRDQSNECVPFDLFSNQPQSAASVAFILGNGHLVDRTDQFVAGANMNTDLSFLKSPLASGPAAIAVGAEYRREGGSTRVDPLYASGDLIAFQAGQNLGPNHYDVKELYGELKVPLVESVPLIRSLNFEAGGRYSKYSTVGGVFTYKAGGDWTPVSGFRFRGIYQRAVRAPNIYELYSPVSIGQGELDVDPCAGPDVIAGSPLANLCVATGVPASLIGRVQQPVAGEVNISQGGNPNLREERSDTYTVGLVATPPQIPGLAATVDYYDITVHGAITNFGVSTAEVVNACYLVDVNINSPFCQALSRNPLTGQLSGAPQYRVSQINANVATMRTAGVDVGLTYASKLGRGISADLTFEGTYTRRFEIRPDASQPLIICAGYFGASCNRNPIPKWKHVASLDLKRGPVALLSRWRFIGAVHEDAGTDILVERIRPQSYIDETLTAKVGHGLELRLGVQNLFDKQPPNVGSTAGSFFNSDNTFPNVYDVLGRTYFVGFGMRFGR